MGATITRANDEQVVDGERTRALEFDDTNFLLCRQVLGFYVIATRLGQEWALHRRAELLTMVLGIWVRQGGVVLLSALCSTFSSFSCHAWRMTNLMGTIIIVQTIIGFVHIAS